MVYNSSDYLSQDMFLHISYSFDSRDITHTSSVNKLWYAHSNHEDVWKYQSRKKWPTYVKIEDLSWKDHYKSNYNGSFGSVNWFDTIIITTQDQRLNSVKGRTGDPSEITSSHTGSINQLYIHQSKKPETKFFTCASDGYINVYNKLSATDSIHRQKIHDRSVNCMEILESCLFTGSNDHLIKFWRFNFTTVEKPNTFPVEKVSSFSLKLMKELKGHTDDVVCLQLSKESNNSCVLFSGSRDNTICVWSMNDESCQLQQRLIGHTSPITALKLHNRTNCLISGSVDKTIRIWSKVNNQYNCSQTIESHKAPIISMIAAPLSSAFFSTDLCGEIEGYQYQDGQWLKISSNSNRDFKIISLKYRRSSVLKIDNTKCCTLLATGRVILWDIDSNLELKPNEFI